MVVLCDMSLCCDISIGGKRLEIKGLKMMVIIFCCWRRTVGLLQAERSTHSNMLHGDKEWQFAMSCPLFLSKGMHILGSSV